MSERDEWMYIETHEALSLDSIVARLRVYAGGLERLASALESPSAGVAGKDGHEPVMVEAGMISFLLGEGPLDGVWFGEKHPHEPGWFWWRKHLREASGWPARPADDSEEDVR